MLNKFWFGEEVGVEPFPARSKKRGTTWTGHQSDAWLMQIQLFTLAANLESPFIPT